jgi:hypothetical protein
MRMQKGVNLKKHDNGYRWGGGGGLIEVRLVLISIFSFV